MAGKLNSVVLLLSLATLLHSSSAQTRLVVGGNTGWTVPPGGPSTYTTWASNQTFKQGDTLVFNFATGQHDVAKVTKAAFDTCNLGNTIFTLNNGPASVKLNETGEQYYICTFGSHCSLGQKLAINVTKQASSSPPSSSPAPQPSPASPAKAPSPAPAAPAPSPSSSGSVTYTVGDKTGWTVPPSGPSFYTNWTSGKNFKVGDILVFNFQKNTHNVAEVTKANYNSCNTASPVALFNNPPVRVTLNKSGEHYYICAVPGHCAGGQKLAIKVTEASSPATSPSPAGSPSSTPSPSPPAPGSPATSPSAGGTNPSSPSPSGAASPPPPNSDATSLRAAGLFATVLWIAAALLC